MNDAPLARLRLDYDRHAGRSVALPKARALLQTTGGVAGLMGRSVLMVDLWCAVHLTLFPTAPELVPLSLGLSVPSTPAVVA